MPWWGETELEKSRRVAHEATRRTLERGQIPYKARHRLEMLRQGESGFFTSDLSCREALLSQQAGYQPLGLVMGTAFYQIGFFGFFRRYQTETSELWAMSQAQLAAREQAVARLQKEAACLGATGVIGVRLKLSEHSWSNRTIEFTAVGTAIRIPGRQPDPQPFTSDLSGQEFWQLHQAGYYPRGLVFGVCSYYVHTDDSTLRLTRGGFLGRGSSQNQEIHAYTQGFQTARHLAMERLKADIRKHGTEGAVGMHIDMGFEDIRYELNNRTRHDLLAHFVAVGTAISQDPEPVMTAAQSPLMFYDLASGRTNVLPTPEPSDH